MSATTVTQARIEAIAKANPGIHTAQLALVLGLAWNTTMHHVRAMERQGRLSVQKIDGKVRIYDRRHGAVHHKVAAALLQDPDNRRIAAHVLQHPGRTQRQLAAALDLSTTAVHRRLSRLEEAGLLQRLAAGRCTLVHATDDLPDAFVETGLRTRPAPQAEIRVRSTAEAPVARDRGHDPLAATRIATDLAGQVHAEV